MLSNMTLLISTIYQAARLHHALSALVAAQWNEFRLCCRQRPQNRLLISGKGPSDLVSK